MRERGSALLVAIVSIMVLMLISGVFFSLVKDQMKSNSYEERAIKSYYLAQAGVFYGIAKIKADLVPELDLITGMSLEEPVLDPFGYGGKFTVQWQEFEDGYKITGTGSYGKEGTTAQVVRTLKAYYKVSGTGGTPGGIPAEIITQELLVEGDYGQGNSSFIFSNVTPLNDSLPVNLNEPIYIYVINKGGNTKANKYATNVRLSLRNSSNQTIPITTNLTRDMTQPTEYLYIIPNFKGATGVNHNGTGTDTPVSILYNGSETVHLVVQGYISNKANDYNDSDGTGTVTNNFILATDDGLIWQVEE